MRYPITSRFGEMEGFRNRPHTGLDLYMKTGTELRSIQDGIVEKVLHLKNNVGNAVLVRWEDGKTAIYAHMDSITVKVGDKVNTGDLLGYSGHSGHVVSSSGGNGEHLHFGLKVNGEFIDPTPHINSLQNMNNPKWIASHTGNSSVLSDLQNFSTSSISDIMSQYMKDYGHMLSELKFNLFTFITSVDYSIFIHYLQDFFKFFS